MHYYIIIFFKLNKKQSEAIRANADFMRTHYVITNKKNKYNVYNLF